MSPTNTAAPGVDTEGERSDQRAASHLQDTASDAAERALTGCLLLVADDIRAEVLATLRDDDIADGRYRFIVSTMRRMIAESAPVHPLSVIEYVASRALLTEGAPRMVASVTVHELASDAPPPVMAGWFAARVLEHAARRRLTAAGDRLTALARGGDVTRLADAVRAEVAEVLAELARVTP